MGSFKYKTKGNDKAIQNTTLVVIMLNIVDLGSRCPGSSRISSRTVAFLGVVVYFYLYHFMHGLGG